MTVRLASCIDIFVLLILHRELSTISLKFIDNLDQIKRKSRFNYCHFCCFCRDLFRPCHSDTIVVCQSRVTRIDNASCLLLYVTNIGGLPFLLIPIFIQAISVGQRRLIEIIACERTLERLNQLSTFRQILTTPSSPHHSSSTT